MNNQKIVYVLGLFLLPFFLLAQIENWVYRYNGPGNLNDSAECVIYGSDGNIYAAGFSTDADHDITVISLTPLWCGWESIWLWSQYRCCNRF